MTPLLDISGETALLLALIVPLAGIPFIVLAHRWPNIREAATLATAGALFLVVQSLLALFLAGARPELNLYTVLPGLDIEFVIEPLGMLFAIVAATLWIVNSIYSIGYLRGNDVGKQTRFYAYFALSLASTMAVALSGNMFTLFFAYEMLTLCTYPLVTHTKTPDALKSGRTYLGLLLGTSVGFQLLAIIWTWSATGTLDFTEGGILEGRVSITVASILLVLYMYGIGKAALMPFHRWLPAAMVAPTPVSALLHAVAVVKAGVFTVVKVIFYIFGLDFMAQLPTTDGLAIVAGITIIFASIIALRQDNLKARLAYSTVSQLSYVILAAALISPISVAGAALHIAAHAVSKITLFFAAGSIYTASGKKEISQLNGVGRRMPITMTAFAIGAISLIGLPPTAGFVSKWYMLQGAMNTEAYYAVAVIVGSTLLNTAYFLPIIYAAFLRQPTEGMRQPEGEAPLPILIALSATALGTILMFFYPDVPLALVRSLTGIQ